MKDLEEPPRLSAKPHRKSVCFCRDSFSDLTPFYETHAEWVVMALRVEEIYFMFHL